MSAPRFFVNADLAPNRDIVLDPDDARHARLVLRLHAGDDVVLVHDGAAWHAMLTTVSAREVRARVGQRRDEKSGELPVDITVMQALIKGAKFDFVVEKVVELGARHVVPVEFERSYAEAGARKLERWRRIARAAAQQARRRFLPSVEEPRSWEAALRGWRGVARPIVAYEGARLGTFAPAVDRIAEAKELAVAIGPEGGFTDDEVAVARASGCALVSLGPTTLRTETAATALLAAIAARKGWW